MKTKPYPNAAGSMGDHAGSMRNHAKSIGDHARALAVTLVLFASACPPCVFSLRAQPIITSVTTERAANVAHGRDFWFVEMSNYWGQDFGGKYLRLYVSSKSNTTAFIESQGQTAPLVITANSVATYLMPESWEMESSGQVENKAIHVWSNDADLTVYTMNHNNYTTDGSYIIPTIGWGTDYVVAAGQSFFEQGADNYDLPSLMAVVAGQDNTTVLITPSCDCRQCFTGNTSGDANSHNVTFPAHQAAVFTLNSGESVELMPVMANADTGFDLSGTIVHANHAVGVFGGAVEAAIPSGFSYSDRLEEMMPPIRRWGKTYYTTSFHEPDTLPLHDSAMYMLASSKTNQMIFHSSCGTNVDTLAIATQFGIVRKEEYKAGKFWSNAPFECAEYANSSLYPDNLNGKGDPSEAIVTPREQFLKTVQFLTPTAGDPFYDYANVVVNNRDANKTFIDAKPITRFQSQCLDSNWEVFVVDTLSVGSHTVSGDDSGVSILAYGYGYDEAYSWGGAGLTSILNSPDTVAPIVTTSAECYAATVQASDSGLLPNNIDSQSTIAEMVFDSDVNMTFVPNSGSFGIIIPGQDTTGYSMDVSDVWRPAYLRIEIFDLAGNETIITSTYMPAMDTIVPPLQNLGVNTAPSSGNVAYDTIYNYGDNVFHIDSLALLKGNVGFTLHDSTGGAIDVSPMPPHSRRLVQIQFLAVQATPVIDSIRFGNACHTMSVAVIGSGGDNDFSVTGQTWPDERVPAPDTGYVETVLVENLSSGAITILEPWWKDTVHFKIAVNQAGDSLSTFPLRIPASPAYVPVSIAYFPDSGSLRGPDTTHGTWKSPDVLKADRTDNPRFDLLTGWAVPYVDNVADAFVNTAAPMVESTDGMHVFLALPAGWELPVHVEIVNVVGAIVFNAPLSSSGLLNIGMLPRGVYFWRVLSGAQYQDGKIILGN